MPTSTANAGKGGKVSKARGELDVSTEVLLEGPELILKDPTSSLTGMALSGMLAAQVAVQVSVLTSRLLNHPLSNAYIIIQTKERGLVHEIKSTWSVVIDFEKSIEIARLF